MATHMIRVPFPNEQTATLCETHMHRFRAVLSQFGQTAGVQAVLLLDVSGRVLGSWYTGSDLHIESMASLISGKWAAARLLGSFVKPDQHCNFIIHEHDTFRLLLARAGEQQILLTITAAAVPIGWTRLHMQRLADLCSEIEQRSEPGVFPLLQPLAS